MKLDYYIDLSTLIETKLVSKEESRAFGLENLHLKKKANKSLKLWIETYSSRLKRPSASENFAEYMEKIHLLSLVLGFVFGIFTGIALLSYSGKEPVNVIYFMAMTILFPLFSMAFSLFSMFRIHSKKTIMLDILPHFIKTKLPKVNITPLLRNGMILKRTQIVSLAFSVGIFISFLSIIATQDIAFSWSSTLAIDVHSFHHFLYTVSFLWRDFYPDGVPSLELIRSSHYFRLEDSLHTNGLDNIKILGDWWQFLALSTLFYAIFLRIIVLIMSHIALNRAIDKAIFHLGKSVLMQMNETLISTNASTKEEAFISTSHHYKQIEKDLYDRYNSIQGWSFEKEELLVLSDSLKKKSDSYFTIGGANSFESDEKVLDKSRKEVLLFVKSWEPPTMDFVDYLQELSQKVEKVIVYPVGLIEDEYVAKEEHIGIWENKLSLYDDEKVWFKK